MADLVDISKRSIVTRAKVNAVRMLTLRQIPGEDEPIAAVHDCPSFVWGIRRGSEWAVVMLNDASKQAVLAVMDYCQPPAPRPEPAEPEETADPPHPHAGNDIRHCIVVYVNKCTVIAGKEIAACTTVAMERFSVEELARCPLDLTWQAEYELLDNTQAAAVRARCGTEGMAEIWTSDKTARWFNAPIGSIFKTTKRWRGLQADVEYRVVTEPAS